MTAYHLPGTGLRTLSACSHVSQINLLSFLTDEAQEVKWLPEDHLVVKSQCVVQTGYRIPSSLSLNCILHLRCPGLREPEVYHGITLFMNILLPVAPICLLGLPRDPCRGCGSSRRLCSQSGPGPRSRTRVLEKAVTLPALVHLVLDRISSRSLETNVLFSNSGS